MVSLTLAISEELKEEMEQFPEINWSVVAREAIKKRLQIFKQIRAFTKDSELTEKDAFRIGKKINEGLAKRWKQ